MTWPFWLLGLVAIIGLIAWLCSRQPKPFRPFLSMKSQIYFAHGPSTLQAKAVILGSVDALSLWMR